MPGEADTQHARSLELLASTELNQRVIEAMPGGIVHVSATGAILAANAEALRILGLSYDELTRRYTQDFEPTTIRENGSPCPAEDYPVTRALVTGERQPPMTIGLVRPNGDVAWAMFTAVPVTDPDTAAVTGVVVTFLDVTQRKIAEAALRRSEELVRSVLESAPNPIATTDRRGYVLSLNLIPAPHTRADTIGLPAWRHILPDDQPRFQACIERVVATGVAESVELMGASGARWLSHIGPRFDGGEIVGATIVAWDVAKQRELERRVAIADRMASLGQLAAGVAHEVNNPLTYLLANLELLKGAVGADADARERLTGAIEGAQRIRDVMADLRSFSHVDEAHRAPLDVNHVLETALRMAQGEIRCRAQVRLAYGTPLPVLASEGRLGQVFLNLVVNAAQAIPEGDIDRNFITITTGMDERGRVFVDVSDTGVGIATEIVDTIFDPFVTTKARGVGTGLGLYICREVVASLGGEIDVRSRPGDGTTVRVSLPAVQTSAAPSVAGDAPPRRSSSADAAAPPPALRRLRILVVDDEAPILSLLRKCLREHDVTTVTSGRDAIAALESTDFDLALCDLVMPDLTGMDVYEHLRDRGAGRERTLVFMSGGAFTERARHFLQTVPNDVLHKPFSLADVARIVARRAGQ